jgi:hypothetical protein
MVDREGRREGVLLGWGLTVSCASPAIAETNSVEPILLRHHITQAQSRER